MVYNPAYDTMIKDDLNILNSVINWKGIFININRRNERQRLSAEISNYIAQVLQRSFQENKSKFKYLENLIINNDSPKEKYEILLKFKLSTDKTEEIYVNLLPTNKLRKSAPFIGSINKYIDRLQKSHIYDMIFLIEYKSEKNKEPTDYKMRCIFTKDIKKISLYKNWQLQVNLQRISCTENRNPQDFINDLILLLKKMKNETVKKIENDCQSKTNILRSLTI